MLSCKNCVDVDVGCFTRMAAVCFGEVSVYRKRTWNILSGAICEFVCV